MYSLSILLTILAGHPLLAENSRFAHMGNRVKDSKTDLDLTGLFAVLGGLLVLVVLGWGISYWRARRESRVVNSPRALFRELCSAHGMSRAERDLLHEIAQWHNLADPVQLFIEPERFQPAEMHEALNCEAEATELQNRLFTAELAV